MADYFAGKGAEMHPLANQRVHDELDLQLADLDKVLKLLGRVWPLWPPVREHGKLTKEVKQLGRQRGSRRRLGEVRGSSRILQL